MYSINKIDGKEHNTTKGVSIATESDICEDVLFNRKMIKHKTKRIQSKKHKLGTYEIDKISLSCFDNKRYVLDDGIYTLSHFCKNRVTSCNNQKDCDYCYYCEIIKKFLLFSSLLLLLLLLLLL